jgi:hypothetical protein
MNKRGMTISINMIIILIIAIVTLGLILSFIYKMFPKDLPFPELTIEPTYDNPISFNPASIQRGKANKLTVGFYNNELEDITQDIAPVISCVDVESVDVSGAGMNVPVGSIGTYNILLEIPKNTPPGDYSCLFAISTTQETFFMEVN